MDHRSRAVATTTVGYMCIALTGWMISMTYADWFSRPYALSILYPLAIVLGVMGILSFFQDRGLDAIVFFGSTALLWSAYAYNSIMRTATAGDPRTYLGWFAFLWAAFFSYVWIGSFKSGPTRMLFLLGLSLTLLSLAIGDWSGMNGFMVLGGYLGLATSLLAGITSAAEIVTFGSRADPNMEVPRTVRPIAAD